MKTALILVASIALVSCTGQAAPSTPPSPTPSLTPSLTPSPTPTSTRPPTPRPTVTAAAYDLSQGQQWIVFAWYPDELFLVRPDGSGRHQVEMGVPGIKFAPAWSPDGHQLIFVMKDEKTPDGSIWTADPDGSNAKHLYGYEDCGQSAYWPTFSPDGTKLGLVCYDRTTATVATLDLATRELTRLADFEYPETVDNPPSWSPDGKSLTFEIIHWDPTDQFLDATVVATVPTAGGEVSRLTDPALFGSHPDWSPDGSLIAFNTYDTGNMHGITQPSNVYTVKPDGTGLKQLSTASTDGHMRLGQPFWSADGTGVWVSVEHDLERDRDNQYKNLLGWVDAATGELTNIGTDGMRFRERPLP